MIFDRTQEDVDAAISLRDKKVKKFETLTSEEINTLERGTITINTLNRIENKQFEIKNLLTNISIDVDIENKSWDLGEIFSKGDFERILKNLDMLIDAFSIYDSSPVVPKPNYTYKNINDIEKILFDIENLYNKAITQIYHRSGESYCGGEI